MNRRNIQEEYNMQADICLHIRENYPDVIFLSDGSGIKLPIGLAVKVARLKSENKVPDLVILKSNNTYNGIVLELKKSENEIYTKNGTIRQKKHFLEQLKSLQMLQADGFFASFVFSRLHATVLIDNYMKNYDVSKYVCLEKLCSFSLWKQD